VRGSLEPAGPPPGRGRAALTGPVLLGLALAVAAVLVFADLGDRYLWEDEAETALLARNVLRFGLPVAWDGRDLISQECGVELNEHYVSRRHGWLPVYLVAASFAVFGADTVAARLPAALLGWLTILSTFVLGRRVLGDDRWAALAAALLALSVPFLLHVRQARYYALAMLATVWALVFFLDLLAGRRLAFLGLSASLAVLVHTLMPMALGTALALGAAWVAVDRRRAPLAGLAAAGAVAMPLAWLGVLLYGWPWIPSSVSDPGSLLLRWADNVWFFAAAVDRRFLPLVVPVAVAVGVLTARSPAGPPEPHRRGQPARPALALLTFALADVLYTAAYPDPFVRYIVNLIPLLVVLLTWLVSRLWRLAPALAVAVVLLVVATDAPHGWVVPHRTPFRSPAEPIRSPLLEYLREITREDVGPIEAIVTLLRQEARPGERLFITYGDLPLRFYTDLQIRGGQGCQTLEGWPLPDWVVVRAFFRLWSEASARHQEDWHRMYAYVSSLPRAAYRAIELPVVDTIWEDIPEPGLRALQRDVPKTARVVVHRRIGGDGSRVSKP
jgi:hypothetical protein